MKKYLLLLIFPLCLWSGCEKDTSVSDVDGLPPTIVMDSEHIATVPGREFVVKARVEDKDGLLSINLKNQNLHLDKTIDLTVDSTVYGYDLRYKYVPERTLEGNDFPIELTVTDLGGRTTTARVLVTMDGDFTHPVFAVVPDNQVTVLLKTETRLNLRFEVRDDRALQRVVIDIPELDYSKEVTEFSNAGRTLVFNEAITLPSVLATYTLSLKAIDQAGLETSKSSVITVSEMPDFPKMYLSDVASAEQLNSDIFGVPMLIDRISPYVYRARYYAATANKEVRFVPQKTDFNPIVFGVDPENTTLLTDDPEVAMPLVLPNKGYYEITFNVQTGQYDVNPYTPTDAPLDIGAPMLLDPTRPGEGSVPLRIGLVGDGLPNAGSWNTANPLFLQQHTDNKYLFSVEMDLLAGAELEFIIQAHHSWGWWPEPFWRWDRGEDPEANVANGGNNPAKWRVQTGGKYIFLFDSHLERSQFYPID